MSTLEDPDCVSLTGRLTVGTVMSGREELLAAIHRNVRVVVHIDPHCDVDVAGVQLLMAARDLAHRKRVALTLASPASGALLDVIHRAGIVDGLSEDERCFWRLGEAA